MTTYASQFVLADVGLEHAADSQEATISLSPLGVTVIAQLPSGNHRIVATVATKTFPPRLTGRSWTRCFATAVWSSGSAQSPPGRPGSGSITEWPNTSGPAECSSPATLRTSTAQQPGRA